MELLDLHDYALLEIFERLDQKSVLKMMEVCDRFERLIGHTRSLYKDFELSIKGCDSSKKLRTLGNIRRLIGSVTVNEVRFDVNQEQFDAADKMFRKIGWKLNQIKFDPYAYSYPTMSTLTNSQFLQLLERASNVESLELDGVQFVPNAHGNEREIKELKNLKKLSIKTVENLDILPSIVPSSLKEFTLDLEFDPSRDTADCRFHSRAVTRILRKLNDLDSLRLTDLTIHRFEYSASNCNIKNLSLEYLQFSDKEASENFRSFLKIQKKVVKLGLVFDLDELIINDYREAYFHLVNLKTLEDLGLGYNEKYAELIKSGKVYNESVKRLKFSYVMGSVDFQPYARCFPNVTSLELHFFRDFDEIDISSIKFLKNLRKLKVSEVDNRMIEQIELAKLQEIIVLDFICIDIDVEFELIENFEELVVFNLEDLISTWKRTN
jgi:hypothetical protein